MHLRKVLADAFEGVTVFHYQHFFDTLNADNTVYARQCSIGGLAVVSMTADLGLSGGFMVWDHPTNMQRQALARTPCLRRHTPPQGANGHTGTGTTSVRSRTGTLRLCTNSVISSICATPRLPGETRNALCTIRTI